MNHNLRTGRLLLVLAFYLAVPAAAQQPASPTKDASKPTNGASKPLVTKTNSIGMKLVRIEAGEFLMGSPEPQEGHRDDERQHRVRITKPFFIGQHEVTFGQFRRFVTETSYVTAIEKQGGPGFGYDVDAKAMELLPKFTWKEVGFEQTENHPVINVTWDDAVAFCKWLSQKEMVEYRLPSEAEWEYTARGGTTTRYWCGDDEDSLKGVANISDAAFLSKYPEASWSIEWNDGFPFSAPVGSYRPNPFGLYDVHGNVWEWCADWYGRDYFEKSPTDDPKGPDMGERRIVRGGAFTNRHNFVRSADRDSFRPKYRYNFTGFRVVQVIAK